MTSAPSHPMLWFVLWALRYNYGYLDEGRVTCFLSRRNVYSVNIQCLFLCCQTFVCEKWKPEVHETSNYDFRKHLTASFDDFTLLLWLFFWYLNNQEFYQYCMVLRCCNSETHVFAQVAVAQILVPVAFGLLAILNAKFPPWEQKNVALCKTRCLDECVTGKNIFACCFYILWHRSQWDNQCDDWDESQGEGYEIRCCRHSNHSMKLMIALERRFCSCGWGNCWLCCHGLLLHCFLAHTLGSLWFQRLCVIIQWFKLATSPTRLRT